MVSNIDPTKPVTGVDQPVKYIRDNFAAAKIEIEELQTAIDNIGGGGSGVTKLVDLTDIDTTGALIGQALVVTGTGPYEFAFDDVSSSSTVSIPIQDEGIEIVNDPSLINFTGSGVTVTNNSGVATVTIPGSIGSSSVPVQDDGLQIVADPSAINFTGQGVTVTNSSGVATIAIPTTPVRYNGTNITTVPTAINFTGPGVTVTDVANVSTVNIPYGPNTDLIPLVDNTYDIGSSSARWSQGWFADKLVIGENDTGLTSGYNVAPSFSVVGSDNNGSTSILANFNNSDSPSVLNFTKSRSASISSARIKVTPGTQLGRIVFSGDDGTGLDTLPFEVRVTVIDDNPARPQDILSRMEFKTDFDTRMQIDPHAVVVGETNEVEATALEFSPRFMVAGTGPAIIIRETDQFDVGPASSTFEMTMLSGNFSIRNFKGSTSSTASRFRIWGSDGAVTPGQNNSQKLGNASYRWTEIFAVTSTINTSDGRDKDLIRALNDEEFAAWENINWKVYKWKESIEEKGEVAARKHFGLIAQEIEQAFIDAGIDAWEYGLLCKDPIYKIVESQVEETDPDDSTKTIKRIVTDEIPVLDEFGEPLERYGVRYTECLAFEAAYQRTKYERISTNGMIKVNSVDNVNLPDASMSKGCMVLSNDLNVMLYCNGTNWLRLDNNEIIV